MNNEFTIGCLMAEPVPYEVWIAEDLPFSDKEGSKSRPVIIIGKLQNTFTCYKITTKSNPVRGRLPICDLDEAGLDEQSFIEWWPVFVGRNKLSKRIGMLSERDSEMFSIKDAA